MSEANPHRGHDRDRPEVPHPRHLLGRVDARQPVCELLNRVEERVEERPLPVEHTGHEAAQDGSEGYPDCKEERDLEDFVEGHGEVLGTAAMEQHPCPSGLRVRRFALSRC